MYEEQIRPLNEYKTKRYKPNDAISAVTNIAPLVIKSKPGRKSNMVYVSLYSPETSSTSSSGCNTLSYVFDNCKQLP